MYPRILLRRAGLLLILCSAASAQYTITEYSTGLTAGSYPYGIAAGPDGALWFTEYSGNRIGRIAAASQTVPTVPTLSEWGMLLLALLLAAAAGLQLHCGARRRASAPQR